MPAPIQSVDYPSPAKIALELTAAYVASGGLRAVSAEPSIFMDHAIKLYVETIQKVKIATSTHNNPQG